MHILYLYVARVCARVYLHVWWILWNIRGGCNEIQHHRMMNFFWFFFSVFFFVVVIIGLTFVERPRQSERQQQRPLATSKMSYDFVFIFIFHHIFNRVFETERGGGKKRKKRPTVRLRPIRIYNKSTRRVVHHTYTHSRKRTRTICHASVQRDSERARYYANSFRGFREKQQYP